jgi:hypothetical protein
MRWWSARSRFLGWSPAPLIPRFYQKEAEAVRAMKTLVLTVCVTFAFVGSAAAQAAVLGTVTNVTGGSAYWVSDDDTELILVLAGDPLREGRYLFTAGTTMTFRFVGQPSDDDDYHTVCKVESGAKFCPEFIMRRHRD